MLRKGTSGVYEARREGGWEMQKNSIPKKEIRRKTLFVVECESLHRWNLISSFRPG